VKEFNKQYLRRFSYKHLAHTEYAFKLRPGRIDDTDTVGKIIFEAFSAIADNMVFNANSQLLIPAEA
jgi:hypothetical protein